MLVARLVKEVMGVEIEAMKIIVDNQSAIMLSKTLTHHNSTKYIDTFYHSIRDCVKDGRVIIKHLKTKDQLADILTKALGRVKFVDLCAKIGVKKAWKRKKSRRIILEVISPPMAQLVRVMLPRHMQESTHRAQMARSRHVLQYLPMRRPVACSGTKDQAPKFAHDRPHSG